MIVNELKSILKGFFSKWVITVKTYEEHTGESIVSGTGFGNYILINRLSNHFVIEILGYQEFSKTPKFTVEDKPCSYEIDFFINGGLTTDTFVEHKGAFRFNHPGYDNLALLDSVNFSVTDDKSLIKDLFDESNFDTLFVRKDGILPLTFGKTSTNTILQNVNIISRVNNQFSFRRHSTTIVIEKNIPNSKFKKLLKNEFNKHKLKSGYILGSRQYTQLISELKSLAYHKVHETTIDKFLQLIADDFAKSLGYLSAKSNIRLDIQSIHNHFGKDTLIPDFLLERKDGYFDILDLKTGLLSNDFVFGNWSNAHFSNYGTKLLGQLKGYKRFFSEDDNREWAKEKFGIIVKNPILIGIAGNHNNFNRELVDVALEGNTADFKFFSYNELSKKLKNIIK